MATAPPVIREEPGDEPEDVLFRPLYGVRSFELNRPKKLNSLNGSMIRKILPRLEVRIHNEPTGSLPHHVLKLIGSSG
jgi:3-hydroxyisobutyryl-CoA hydrolase